MSTVTTAPDLIGSYEEQFAGSRARFDRSKKSLAGGIAHDGRHLNPFPLQIERADGAYKWDVDGNKFIDYAVGHGSLILGHNNPEIVRAMHTQLDRGTHYSAGHEAEILWAQQVQKMVPSAELVRFTGSGTESNLLAMRLGAGLHRQAGHSQVRGPFSRVERLLDQGREASIRESGSARRAR